SCAPPGCGCITVTNASAIIPSIGQRERCGITKHAMLSASLDLTSLRAAYGIPLELPLAAAARNSCHAFDGIACHAPGKSMLEQTAVYISTETKADLIASQPSVLQRHAARADAHGTGDHLILLLERNLVRQRLAADRELPLPRADDYGRHDPEINRAVAARVTVLFLHFHLEECVGLPVVHREIVRHHACA